MVGFIAQFPVQPFLHRIEQLFGDNGGMLALVPATAFFGVLETKIPTQFCIGIFVWITFGPIM